MYADIKCNNCHLGLSLVMSSGVNEIKKVATVWISNVKKTLCSLVNVKALLGIEKYMFLLTMTILN